LCPTAAASLVRFFANQSPQYLRNLVQTLQQLISLRVLSGNFSESILPNDNKEIVACTKMLKLLYFANVLDNCPTATVEDHEDWYVFSRAARSSERQVILTLIQFFFQLRKEYRALAVAQGLFLTLNG